MFAISFAVSISALAQDDGGGGGGGANQVGFFVGNVLPHKVSPQDEIFPLWGIRYSRALGGKGAWAEADLSFANSEGMNWQALSAGARMDIPIETLIAHAGLGLDSVMYKVNDGDQKYALGGHFIGGVMSQMGPTAFLRFDMKLQTKPGTILFFGLAFVVGF